MARLACSCPLTSAKSLRNDCRSVQRVSISTTAGSTSSSSKRKRPVALATGRSKQTPNRCLLPRLDPILELFAVVPSAAHFATHGPVVVVRHGLREGLDFFDIGIAVCKETFLCPGTPLIDREIDNLTYQLQCSFHHEQ